MKTVLASLLLFASSLFSAPESFERLRFHGPPKPISPEAETEDWPRFLGPRHDLHSRETRLLKAWPASGPHRVWEVERGSGHAPVVVAGDYLVLIHEMNGREIVECLQPETGKRYWKFDYPVALGSNYGIEDAPRAGPVIDGDLVFTVGVRGDFHCFRLSSGEVVWKRNLDDEYGPAPLFFGRGSCPLVDGDQVIVNVGGQMTVASFHKRTGELLWSAKHGWHASYASPVPAVLHGQKRLLVFTGGMVRPPKGGLLSLVPETGAIEAEFPWRARMYASVNAASPVVVGDSVFITEGYTEGGALLDFDPSGKVSPRWKADRFGSQFTTPVAEGGYLYGVVGTGGTEMVCYEIESGQEMWRDGIELRAARLGRASLVHVDGAFLCIGDQGTLLWLNLSPSGPEILAEAQLFQAPETWGIPTVSRGLLFVNQNAMGSRLICYDLRQ